MEDLLAKGMINAENVCSSGDFPHCPEYYIPQIHFCRHFFLVVQPVD